MASYTLSKQAVTKTARTVKSYGTDPKRRTQQQSRRVSNATGKGGDTGNIENAIIKSGNNGIYVCNIVNADGSVSDTESLLVASRATAYDLPADKRIMGGYFPTETA